MRNRVITFLMVAVALLVTSQANSTVKERNNKGAMLELNGKMWHGAGQAGTTGFDGFENYWNIAPADQKPNLFMDYYDTWNMNEHWYIEMKQEILKYHRQGYYVVPQIGVNIYYLWHQYIEGTTQDDEIDNLVKGLRHLAIPCFIRVGYEWNNYPGDPWLQPPYTPEQLKKVFEKICGKIKAANLEMATVWNIGLSGGLANDKNMMQYWPGKEYMDWMGYNAFASDICNGEHACALAMIRYADSLGLPVMIGEASPNRVNSPNGFSNWNDFFGPYIKMLGEQPSIKQMCYINWDWEAQDMIGGNGLFPWGDSRLQNPGSVKDQWFAELKKLNILSACSEKETRSYFGYNDSEAPDKVTIRRDGKFLVWNDVKDKGTAGLAHYTIYKDGNLWDYTIDPKFPVKDLYNGKTANIQVTAMDRAGNESSKSNTLNVKLDKAYELIWDGGFDYPATSVAVDWKWMGTMDAGAKTPPDDIYIDTTGKITGKGSCWFPNKQELVGGNYNWWRSLPKDNPQDWKVQLFQCFQVQKGEKYTITFKAVADEARTIKVYFMDHHIEPDHTFIPSNGTADPKWESNGEWQYYNSWSAEIGTEVKSFKFEATAPETECARLSFMFGKVEPTQMWIDDVSVLAGDPSDAISHHVYDFNSNYLDLAVLHGKTQRSAKISYNIPQKSHVNISVYNSKGALVNKITNELKNKGNYTHTWNTSHLSSGVYFVKIKACNRVGVSEVVITR